MHKDTHVDDEFTADLARVQAALGPKADAATLMHAFALYHVAHALANLPEQLGHELSLMLQATRIGVDARVEADVSLE
jgi:hypothetical protein